MATGYGDLAGYYSLLFPLNDGQRGFFAHLLETGPVASVLDVGCGTGEHLAWFSERGVRAWGLEPDAAMFRELRRRRWPGSIPTLVQAGVAALPGAVGERVDLALCLGNTLPHLGDRDAVRDALRRMAGTLAPGGVLVVQTVNFDKVLAAGASSFPVIERALPDGGRISFHREYDLGGLPAHVLFRTRLVTLAGEQAAAWPLLPLRRDELVALARDAGLDRIDEFGDYSRLPFAPGSPALIIVGRAAGESGRAAVVSQEDLALLVQAGLSEADIRHSILVARKAVELAERTGQPLDMGLVARGALFHDLGKALTHSYEHGELGAEIGRSLGLPKAITDIARKHFHGGLTPAEARALDLPALDYTPRLLEERIILYADRLVDILTEGFFPFADEREAEARFEEIVTTHRAYGKDRLTSARYVEYHREIASLIGRAQERR